MNDEFSVKKNLDKSPEVGSKWVKPEHFKQAQQSLARKKQEFEARQQAMGGGGRVPTSPPGMVAWDGSSRVEVSNPVYSLEHQRSMQQSATSRVSVDV